MLLRIGLGFTHLCSSHAILHPSINQLQLELGHAILIGLSSAVGWRERMVPIYVHQCANEHTRLQFK